jgi:hypothetical protein
VAIRAIMIRLFGGLDGQWKPAERPKDKHAKSHTGPSSASGFGHGFGLRLYLGAVGAMRQHHGMSAAQSNVLGTGNAWFFGGRRNGLFGRHFIVRDNSLGGNVGVSLGSGHVCLCLCVFGFFLFACRFCDRSLILIEGEAAYFPRMKSGILIQSCSEI